MDQVRLRRSETGDILKMMDIERLCFSLPWHEETFMEIINDESAWNRTAWYGDDIAGYLVSLSGEKMVHLLNLAVHPKFQRKGIARSMLEEMISFASQWNKSYVFLEVRKSNAPAQALYASLDFSHACTWHRYYAETGEDACVMVKKL